ncbi:RagB/SusD family nutrient uptake outer membrane protein [Mucilaginibacter sp. HC2]|uniref:RagB/SusD family nutrient uptake outer membrane protein n=1 Tax=Mucilaginibacter inviolabilis TaxID=2714892 RepID=UPI00140D8DFE|nr:RagB/SusD family nutrient uptake outer membrane protein [Mucilaginibacter inviolabilis]NHA02365.1 RagB/SusD family nutrient uptake outer membrane protein [Mucilaginibacter inviolabilis]
MNLLKKIFIAVLIITAIAGCKKLDIVPTDRFSDATFWKVDANVYNALYNNYHLIYNDGLYFSAEALSDNAYSRAGDVAIISGGNATASTGKFAGDWSNYYSDIKSCNEFLTFVNQNTTLSKDVLNRMIAETRFLRAFAHFNLTKWYGDVPLVTDNITPDEAKVIARTPKADVIKFILSELDAALPYLPSKDQLAVSENGRITKGAALALEARVLLYQGDRMADVVTVCEKLINNQTANGTYSLNPSYTALFSDKVVNKTNNETILSLQYVPTTPLSWSDFFDFAPLSVGGRVISMSPTQELVNDYIMLNGKAITDATSGYDENNPYVNRDPRFTATIVYDGYKWDNGGGVNGTSKTIYIKPGSDPSDKNGIPGGPDEYVGDRESSSPTGYYWRKYFDPNAQASYVSGLNLHLFRYAEILLDYAEAKNSLGQMNATIWNQTIGALRARAGFTDPGALNYPTTGDMTAIIRRERRVELALEGLRVDDIRRWKIAEVVMNGYAHGARFSGDFTTDNGYIRAQKRQFNPSRDYLWAIPANDLSLDKNLTQNPGY